MSQKIIYQATLPYLLTTVVQGRWSHFADRDRAQSLAKIIHEGCRLKRFHLIGFAILPDHVHLLVFNMRRGDAFEKTSSGWVADNGINKHFTTAHLMQCIKGYYSRTIHRGTFWQPGYYARIMNTDEYLSNAVAYIRGNYHKHKLGSQFSRWPYLWLAADIGSMIEKMV